MGNRTTKLDEVKQGAPFTWGEVTVLFNVGEYDIAEYHPWKTEGVKVLVGEPDHQQLCYHGWINGTNLSRSWDSLDAALAGCIAHKHEGPNHRADEYFIRSITKGQG